MRIPLVAAFLLLAAVTYAADGDRPAAQPQPARQPAMMGPFGPRDMMAELVATLGEINLSPDFDLSHEQKEKIRAAREAFKAEQAKWRADHADELRKLQEQTMKLFGRGGQAGPDQFQALNKSRQEVMSTAPDSAVAAEKIEAMLTEPQRAQLAAWRDDPAHQPANPFGGFGGPPAAAPTAATLPSDGVPKAPGFYRLKFQTTVQLPTGPKRVSMAYVLYLPANYDASAKDRHPTLVFFHGAGEVGTDGNAIFANGPAMELQRQGLTSAFAKKFPFVLVCPQCPPRGERWDQPVMLKAVLALLDDVATKVRTDPDRLYVTGLSMGGKGTWLLSMEAPGRFAAIAPIAADTLDTDGAARLKKIATWAIVGAEDFGGAPQANQKMVAAIQAAGGDAKVTIVPGEGHFVWPKFYADPAFYDWFLTHKRAPANDDKADADAKAPR